MNTKMKLAAATAAVLTVTACGTGAERESAASSSVPVEVASTAISAAQRFGAEHLDMVSAHAALADGRPVLVGLPDGGNPACHAALLLPGDPKVWILNRSAAPTEGAPMSRETLQYGCTGVAMPGDPAPVVNLPLDIGARDAAKAAGVPFIYALPDGDEPACHTAVVLPSGDAWVLNRSGGAPVEGAALDREGLAYGCDSGVERPGGAR
ncbi:hypothetical protein [Mycobacteroides chelonae]|uniref:hypothetical protein n=1 Tax=Mycobacteroides chelonae TaxID=1774 RepID=UPI0018B09953|nr:hypothetical protein [Mycobacteroides chelonae]MBF9519501.1 hypothetical protein [Mycobacteroides chelonae]